jgi:hypothetical protein
VSPLVGEALVNVPDHAPIGTSNVLPVAIPDAVNDLDDCGPGAIGGLELA